MAVEIKFEANEQYQRDAIDSVVELFAGQEAVDQGFALPGAGEGELLHDERMLEGFQELVFGNSLSLTASTLQGNLRRIQDGRAIAEDGTALPVIPDELREPLAPDEIPVDFSVEMETGTGKTYVYLRTIAELNRKYGFSKFVVVVPSVAIREGALTSLRLLRDHIREVYDGLQYDSYVYESKALTRVRQFATASHLQIMVINIDSFTSDTNVINRPTDAMNGYAPIEFLRACRPIVVMDEPQNMESPTRQRAVASLSPLLKLRYSATHRDLKHLVYRLTPVDAYDQRLVKRIGVLSVTKDDDLNEAFVEVSKINATPGSVTATAFIDKTTGQVTKRTRVTLRKDDDLYELSGRRSVYQGWAVEDIRADPGIVEFGNGRRIRAESSTGEGDDQLQRLQIRQAIESHFEKELHLLRMQRRSVIPAAVKPLTLFFVDRVANYYPVDGKIRVWFEDEYESVRNDAKFRNLAMPAVTDVHDGYFATTARGVPKDTQDTERGRNSADAATAFDRIMRNKEQLLSFEEPLRFIFSHSALAEGWDNPNVFTICNLQDGRGEMRKRQQIGRGLRLPVMANGERCRVDDINLLTVIANEAFSTFADALQDEIEDETGVSFENRIVDLKRDKVKLTLRPEVLEDPIFAALWARISPRTTYELSFETDDVVNAALSRLAQMEPPEPIKFRIARTEIDIRSSGVSGTDHRDRGSVEVTGARNLPDVVGELCRRVPLSRGTIVRILKESERLDEVKVNPSVFIDRVAQAMNEALYDQVSEGIVYRPLDGERWEARLFADHHQDETFAKIVVAVSKSITDKVVCDSNVEETFAKFLEDHDEVRLFLKLPGWFLVPTPLGNYNPDWAFVREEPQGRFVYLVRETKGGHDIETLRFETEGWKIKCGHAHFRALKVDYAFGNDPKMLVESSAPMAQHGSEPGESGQT
jgi:type III restriction enzyme